MLNPLQQPVLAYIEFSQIANGFNTDSLIADDLQLPLNTLCSAIFSLIT